MKHELIFGSFFCLLAHAQTTQTLSPTVINGDTQLVVANHGSPRVVRSVVGPPVRADGITLESTGQQMCHGVSDPPPVLCKVLRQYDVPQSYTMYQSLTMLYNLSASRPSPVRLMMSMAEQALYKQQLQTSSQLCGGIVTVNATINALPYRLEINLSDPKKTMSVTAGEITNTFNFTSSMGAGISEAPVSTDVAPVKFAGLGWTGTVTFSSAQTCGSSAKMSSGMVKSPNCAVGELVSRGRSMSVNMTNPKCAEGAGIGPALVNAWIDTIIELGGTVLNGLGVHDRDEIPQSTIERMVAFTPLAEPISYTLIPKDATGSRTGSSEAK